MQRLSADPEGVVHHKAHEIEDDFSITSALIPGDFGIWQVNCPTNVGSAATIPEPATLGLLLIGGLALLRMRK